MTADKLAEKISQLAYEKKGNDITIMDLRGLTDVADFFVLISCESDVHVKTIAHHIEKELNSEKIKPWHREGYQQLNWVLLDYVEVVAHIFRPEIRAFYNLEKLWADAKITRVDDNAGIRIISEPTN